MDLTGQERLFDHRPLRHGFFPTHGCLFKLTRGVEILGRSFCSFTFHQHAVWPPHPPSLWISPESCWHCVIVPVSLTPVSRAGSLPVDPASPCPPASPPSPRHPPPPLMAHVGPGDFLAATGRGHTVIYLNQGASESPGEGGSPPVWEPR